MHDIFSVIKFEQEEVSTFKAYLHRYATPYMASKSSSPLWYAVRRASAHIIVLSSYSPFGNIFHLISSFILCAGSLLSVFSFLFVFALFNYLQGNFMYTCDII